MDLASAKLIAAGLATIGVIGVESSWEMFR